MDYREALDYIHGTLRLGSKLGLENISDLLARLGNPHNSFKAIHVAGTNGKGSVTSMIAHVLTEAGYTVGMFVSPYLEEFTERIQVNLKEISHDDLARITKLVKDKIDGMVEEGKNHPTEFEIVTAIGFTYFAEKKVDIAVVEVGLGGRLDSTNVLDPLISVITSISYDHMNILGDTLEKIAFEKAGIIKEGKTVISYPQHEEAATVIRDVAREKSSSLVEVSPDQIRLKRCQFGEQIFDFMYGDERFDDIKIRLNGGHQLINAATALTALITLNKTGFSLSRESIYNGLNKTHWPGRLELVLDNPRTIIDGAHNAEGAAVLAETIRKHFSNTPITLVFGILRDKEVDAVAKTVCRLAETVILTRPDSPRSLNPEELVNKVGQWCSTVIIEPNIEEAVEKGLKNTKKDGMLLICGSFYLIGRARSYIKRSH